MIHQRCEQHSVSCDTQHKNTFYLFSFEYIETFHSMHNAHIETLVPRSSVLPSNVVSMLDTNDHPIDKTEIKPSFSHKQSAKC